MESAFRSHRGGRTLPREEIRKFWEQTRAALDEVELDAIVEPIEETDVFSMEGSTKTRSIYR